MDEHVVSKAQCNNLAVQWIGLLDSKRAGTKGIKKNMPRRKITKFDSVDDILKHLLKI